MTDPSRVDESELKSPLIDQPEYLRAIGLVTVEINAMEAMLSAVFGLTAQLKPNMSRSIYYAPKAAGARVDILIAAAAQAEISDAVRTKILSTAKRAKGVLELRNGVIHDQWSIPLGSNIVHRFSKGVLEERRPAPMAELDDIIHKARRISERCLILMARLTIGKHLDVVEWPDTFAELNRMMEAMGPAGSK